eukprot:IDg1546t1
MIGGRPRRFSSDSIAASSTFLAFVMKFLIRLILACSAVKLVLLQKLDSFVACSQLLFARSQTLLVYDRLLTPTGMNFDRFKSTCRYNHMRRMLLAYEVIQMGAKSIIFRPLIARERSLHQIVVGLVWKFFSLVPKLDVLGGTHSRRKKEC